MRITEACQQFENCTFDPTSLLPCGANIDPRLSAEETCAVSLVRDLGHSQLQDGWNLLELGLATEEMASYRRQAEEKFQAVIEGQPGSQNAYNAAIALASMPLFEKVATGVALTLDDRKEVYRENIAILDTLPLQTSEAMIDSQSKGVEAEIISLNLLLRSGAYDVFPASYRSDKSKENARLNHDIEVFEAGTKIPTQIKRARYNTIRQKRPEDKSFAFEENGIATILLGKFIRSTIMDYGQVDYPTRHNYSIEEAIATVHKLMVEEIDHPHCPGSQEDRLLTHLGEKLFQTITDYRRDTVTPLPSPLIKQREAVIKTATKKEQQIAAVDLKRYIQKKSDSQGNATGRLPLTTLRLSSNIVVTFDQVELRTVMGGKNTVRSALAIAAMHGEFLDLDDIEPTKNVVQSEITLKNTEQSVLDVVCAVDTKTKELLSAPRNPDIIIRLLRELKTQRNLIQWSIEPR